MDMKRFIMAAVAAFVFSFIYESIVHGYLMMGQYANTSSVWRPTEEMNMGFMALSHLLFGLAIAFFYPIVGTDTDDCKKAIPFGVGLGLIMSVPQLATYNYLPIPLTLSLLWGLIAFVKAFGASYIVSKIYNMK